MTAPAWNNRISHHRFARIDDVDDYLMLGWVPLDTLSGTPHGAWSVDVGWLCQCVPVEPRRAVAARAEGLAR